MGRKQTQKLCDWHKKKHSKVIELKLAPIENVVEVKKQSSFNNKAVNDKIVTAAKMYLVLTILNSIKKYWAAVYSLKRRPKA